MGKRTVQHRARSEERQKNKLLSDLKQEVQVLRRKVSRLQKQAQKVPEPAEEEFTPLEEALKCSACKADVVVLETPTSKLRICKACGLREKEK